MTLRDEVLKIMEERNFDQAGFSKSCNVNPSSMSKLIKTGYISNSSIKKMVEVYGKRFEQYYFHKTCELCGEDFIPMISSMKFCGEECAKTFNVSENRERDKRNRDKRKAAGETKAERYKWRAKVKPPEVTIVEFMSGEQYGDRQKQYLLSIQKTQRMEIR